MADSPLYHIWSAEHAAWWKPNRLGYTRNLLEAGQYTDAQATKIVADAGYDFDGDAEEVIMKAMTPVTDAGRRRRVVGSDLE